MFEDRGGILTLVGGLVGLSVVATGLALVMEKRSESAKIKEDAEKTVLEDRQVMDHLRSEIDSAAMRWNEVSGRAALAEKVSKAKAISTARVKKLEELRATEAELRQTVSAQIADYSKYRDDYLTSVRAGAIGEQIAILKLKNGKEYAKVTINRVTPEGIEIRHEFGVARVVADDLDEAWNDRFQWQRTGTLSAAD